MRRIFGSSWVFDHHAVAVAFCYWGTPGNRHNDLGLRVARSLTQRMAR